MAVGVQILLVISLLVLVCLALVSTFALLMISGQIKRLIDELLESDGMADLFRYVRSRKRGSVAG